MSQPIYGRITNYRIGPKTQDPKCLLIRFEDTPVSKTGQLIGRRVVWKEGKNKFVGKIVGLHGRNGVVKARFRKGVPGWAIGTNVELVTR